jgi:hypothetical protein
MTASAPQITLVDFQTALESTKDPKHVLLGNGFSMACRSDIFAYDKLFERADFSSLSSNAQLAFQRLKTTDFEVVMRALKSAATLIELYGPEETHLAIQLRNDAEGLRDVLASAIAQSHPGYPGEIGEDRYRSCRKFLSNFARMYSVSYDLLLYWTLMQSALEPELACDDGFRKCDDPEAGYVTWEPENRYEQNVYFLHGALYLFDAGAELQKYTWVNTGVRLLQQIRQALARDLFPLIVAEGDSNSKRDKILHSMYLSHAYKSMLSIGGTLFVYGIAFHENDGHIARIISRNKGLKGLAVGVYGHPDSVENRGMIQKICAVADTHRPPLQVVFFDAQTANVWG